MSGARYYIFSKLSVLVVMKGNALIKHGCKFNIKDQNLDLQMNEGIMSFFKLALGLFSHLNNNLSIKLEQKKLHLKKLNLFKIFFL